MNTNETELLSFLVGISVGLNLKVSFREVCDKLSDACLFYIINIALVDWQAETAQQILNQRKTN